MPIRSLTKELQEKAINELNEVPSRVQEDINHLKDWITKQPHLKARLDDQWLVGYLRGCKYSLQRAKEKIELYYTIRSLSPEFFGKRDLLFPDVHAYYTQRITARLPSGTDLGPQRYLVKCKHADPDKLTITNALKATLMMIDVILNTDDLCVIGGQEVIFDLQDLHYNYMAQLTPNILKKSVLFMRDVYPTRLKGIYFINLPRHLQFVTNIIRSLLPEKLRKRFHLYTTDNIEDFYKRVPRSVFPEEYGGYAGPFNKLSDELRLSMEKQRNWLLEDSIHGCDETKQIEKSKYVSEFFNLEGSFRKLEID